MSYEASGVIFGIVLVIVLTYGVPLFCLLARFLGYPWRRRARF
jgi:hypothetical protein